MDLRKILGLTAALVAPAMLVAYLLHAALLPPYQKLGFGSMVEMQCYFASIGPACDFREEGRRTQAIVDRFTKELIQGKNTPDSISCGRGMDKAAAWIKTPGPEGHFCDPAKKIVRYLDLSWAH